MIRDKFKADFLLFEKSDINGPNTCETYKFLRHNTEALYDAENEIVQEVPWNFAKFLIDGTTGQVVSYYNPRVSPLSLRTEIETICSRGAPYVHKDYPVFVNAKANEANSGDTCAGSGCGGPDKADKACKFDANKV